MHISNQIMNLKRKIYWPIKEQINDYKLRADFKKHLRDTDVFIVGHPKSGNTWLCRMVASLIEENLNTNINLSNIREAIPAFHDKDNEINLYGHLPNPRLFRNEGPVYPTLYPKTIYILRDPRSVYVSYYHHCVHDTQDHTWRIEDFVDEMLAYGCIKKLEPYLVRWDIQVSRWLELSKSQPVLFVRYEDMHRDKEDVLKRVARFIGIKTDQQSIDTALVSSTFENMRKEEVKFGAEPYSGDKGDKGFYVRKGKIDGWKNEMPAHVSAKIEKEFQGMMAHFEYS